MIIHIAGAMGSGKTTLGKRIQEYNKKVIVIDLDDLRNSYYDKCINNKLGAKAFAKNYKSGYQRYIDENIRKHSNIVFVGINTYINNESVYYIDRVVKYPRCTFDLHSDYHFCIKLDINTNIKQLYDREYINHINWFHDWMIRRKDNVYNNIMNNEKKALNDISIALTRLLHFNTVARKEIVNINKFYKKQGYICIDSDNIYKKVISLIC